MSGRRNWINPNEHNILILNGAEGERKCTGQVTVRTESSGYVQTAKCAETLCMTILAWYNAGGDDDGSSQFAAKNCTCDPKQYCCKAHRDTYECCFCDDEELEEEEENEKKRSREEEDEE